MEKKIAFFTIILLIVFRPVLEAYGSKVYLIGFSVDAIVSGMALVMLYGALFLYFSNSFVLRKSREPDHTFIFQGITLAAFILSSAVSVFTSIHFRISLAGFLFDLLNALVFLCVIVFFDINDVQRILKSFILALFIYGIDALASSVIQGKTHFASLHYFRSGGYLTQVPAYVIGPLMLYLVFALILFVMLRSSDVFSRKLSFFNASSLIWLSLAIVLMGSTGSRSALLSFFLFSILFFKRSKPIIFFSIILSFTALIYIYFKLDPQGFDRLLMSFDPRYYASLNFSKTTVAARVLLFKQYFLSEVPFFGYGQRMFYEVSRGFFDPGSLYTNLWVCNGPIGFLSFMIFNFSLLWLGIKNKIYIIGRYQIATILSALLLCMGESALIDYRGTYFYVLQGIVLVTLKKKQEHTRKL